MKKLIYIFTFLISNFIFAQESFKKAFHVNDSIKLKFNTIILLKKETKVMYEKMDPEDKKKIEEKFPLGSEIEILREETIEGKKVTVEEKIKIDENFYKKQFIIKSEPVTFDSTKKSTVKFVENKLIVNPFLTKKDNTYSREVYSYQLENRQTIKLRFNEFTVSGLIIPIKYRFKDKSEQLPEEFTVAANANLFLGFSMGKTSFHYREKVDNLSNTWKFTFGAFIGASSIKLNGSNTSNSSAPLTSEITKGAASTGIGLCFSFNKINVGTFYGYDYAFGDDTEKWNYNKKPWLGLALGYSIFNL